ncbi:MAG: hypothetical protein JXB47_01810, partial [Anaerolineae bacterium]|nr:hypothetical protein [Anaerolineae bacterium]
MDFIPETAKERTERLGYKAIAFEQAHWEDRLAGCACEKPASYYEKEIYELLSNAGASHITLQHGKAVGRAAIRLHLVWGSVPVEIVQVALPTQSESENVNDKALRQALYRPSENVLDSPHPPAPSPPCGEGENPPDV